MQVLFGRYVFICQVNGSRFIVNVCILMDSDFMNGRKFEIDDKIGIEFVVEEIDFIG